MWTGRYRYEEKELFGHLALQRHLRESLEGRPAHTRPSRIEFASSSVGRLLGVYESLFRSLRTGTAQFDKFGQRKDVPVYHLYPSLGQMLCIATAGEYQDLQSMGMTGPGADWFESWFPRSHFAHHDLPWPHRTKTSHHCKMIAGLTAADDLVWKYSGSHNFSGAAWGKFERSTDAAAGSDFVVMSYELGVLFVPETPLPKGKYMIPWVTPVRPYAEGTVPWSPGALSQTAGGEGHFSKAAAADVHNAATIAATVIAEPLPRLLTLPAGAATKLVQLQNGPHVPLQIQRELPSPDVSRTIAGGMRRLRQSELTLVTRQASSTTEQQPPTVKAETAAPKAEWIAKAGAPSESQTFSRSMDQESASVKAEKQPIEKHPEERQSGGNPLLLPGINVKVEDRAKSTAVLQCRESNRDLIGAGEIVIGMLAQNISVGAQVKKGEKDFTVNFYELVTNQLEGPSRYVADRFSDGAAALSVVNDVHAQPQGPAAGLLLLFLAPTAHQNKLLLTSLARCRALIDSEFWGLLPLLPGDIKLRDNNWEPSHADVLAHMHGVTAFPALVPISHRDGNRLQQPVCSEELQHLLESDHSLNEWVQCISHSQPV